MPPARRRVDLALGGAHGVDAQADGAVGEVDDVPGLERRGEPAQPTDMRPASPSSSVPQANVRRSPGLSSATSSRSGPMRSLGPGRSWRIATWRPAWSAAVRRRAAVSAFSSGVPCEKFRRATSIPASIIRTSISWSRWRGRSWRRSSCGAWRPWRRTVAPYSCRARRPQGDARRRPGPDRALWRGPSTTTRSWSGCSPTADAGRAGRGRFFEVRLRQLLRQEEVWATGDGVRRRAVGPAGPLEDSRAGETASLLAADRHRQSVAGR